MNRQGKLTRRAELRDRKRALAQFEKDGVWRPPPADECVERTIVTEPDATTLVIDRSVRWHGALVEYAVVLKVADGDGWREVFSIDTTEHGCVHRHRGVHGQGSWTKIRSIRSQQDVDDSWNSSWNEVWDEYGRL